MYIFPTYDNIPSLHKLSVFASLFLLESSEFKAHLQPQKLQVREELGLRPSPSPALQTSFWKLSHRVTGEARPLLPLGLHSQDKVPRPLLVLSTDETAPPRATQSSHCYLPFSLAPTVAGLLPEPRAFLSGRLWQVQTLRRWYTMSAAHQLSLAVSLVHSNFLRASSPPCRVVASHCQV